MKRLLLMMLILSSITSYSQLQKAPNLPNTTQEITWAKATHWKVYSLSDKQAANYPIDTLKNFKSKALSDDTMRPYLNNVRSLGAVNGAVWQGYIVGTCEVNGLLRKVIFSTYGGFFYDPTTGHYFEIPDDLELRKEWHAYLSSSLMAADPNAVIP